MRDPEAAARIRERRKTTSPESGACGARLGAGIQAKSVGNGLLRRFSGRNDAPAQREALHGRHCKQDYSHLIQVEEDSDSDDELVAKANGKAAPQPDLAG